METKTLRPTSVSAKADGKGSITAVFATLNVIDHDGDVTLPGAFGKQDVRIQPGGHDTRLLPIGKGSISEVGDKAILDGTLNLSSDTGREAYEALKFDATHGRPLIEWSYIFDIVDADFGEFQTKRVRFLKRLRVHSVDPVFLGAGIGTQTVAVKAANGLLPATRAELEAIRESLPGADLRRAAKEARGTLETLAPAIAKARVEPRLIELAEKAAADAAAMLGIPVPEVQWFPVEPGKDAPRGYTLPGAKAVWLSAGLSTPAEVVRVVGHECKHLTQSEAMAPEAKEADAQAFAEGFYETRYMRLTRI